MKNILPTRRRQKNTSTSQLVAYIVLLILLVIFLATVGIQIVVKTSVFLAGFTTKKTALKTEESSILIEPEIDNLPDATSSARIQIEGKASENTIIEIFINEEKTEEAEATDGTFSKEVTLNPGENSLYVRSSDKKKVTTKDSQIYKVVYINKNPELNITSPQDGSEVDKDEISISGSVTENTTVKVNGLPTIVTSTNTFSRSVQLSEGENTITISATDLANVSIEKQLKITYRK